MKTLHMVTWILLIVGGLNWLLTAFGYNVVGMLGPSIAMIVYILVGLSAIFEVVNHKNTCKECATKTAM